ncbi:MAG: histidine kinase [Dehalococcoidales bacterium]
MNIYVIAPLICAAIYGGLAAIVLHHPTKERVVFALYLLAGTGWSLTSAMAHIGFAHQQTYFWAKLIVITAWPMMVFYYHFVCFFTNRRHTPWAYLGYGLWVVIIVLTALGYILRDAYFAQGTLHFDYGVALNPLAASSAPFMIAAVICLIQHYRASTDSMARNRTIYLLVGISIFVLFGATNLIPTLFRYPIDYLGGIINALLISYAILKYQLLDIKLVVRKGLVYSSLTIFLTTLYLLLLFIVQTLFHEWVGFSLALAAGFALVAAVLFNPLRNLIQKWIDQIFYRETYDYRQMLLSFSDRVSNVLDLGELAQSILDPIIKAMHAKKASLLFPGIESSNFSTQFSQQATKEEPPIKLRFTDDNPVVTWLATEGKALKQELIDIIPQFKGLWETERVALKSPGLELLCPIRSRGDLIGILAVGEKQSESPYTDEEIDLFMTMANEAAVAVENARMLNSLKNQELRVRQLLAQAVHAQEEERKRISVDLHDSVAQWLVAASYRAQTCSQILPGDDNNVARQELADMENTLSKSLKELRRVVTGLRPPALDELGLNYALKQSLEDLKADGLDCQFSKVGTQVRLPSSIEIAVYRVVQEALNNVRKHANATKVNLRLQFLEDKLLVEVRDNGRGFDLPQTLDSATSVGHMGLLGMKQRAETLGGNIKIKTGEGAGTTIILSLPIQPQVEEK